MLPESRKVPIKRCDQKPGSGVPTITSALLPSAIETIRYGTIQRAGRVDSESDFFPLNEYFEHQR